MSISLRPAARQELADLLVRIWAVDPHAADRVRDSVQRTLEALKANPLSGTRRRVLNPRLGALRILPVHRYPQFVVLYLPAADGIDVLHIVRGRRNLGRVITHD